VTFESRGRQMRRRSIVQHHESELGGWSEAVLAPHPALRGLAARSVLLAGVLLLAASALLAQRAPDDPARFAPVGDLAGSCWIGTFEDGSRDVHCYEWTLDGGFLRDRHQVHGQEGRYAGETLYGWDEGSESLRFWYFNTLGGVSEGAAVRDSDREGGRWLLTESYRGGHSSLELRTLFDRSGEDSYDVVTQALRGGEWVERSRVRFTRLGGPRPAALGGAWAQKWDLVFNSNRDGNYEIYRLDLTTGEERNLTAAPGTEWVYAGGERLLLVSDREPEPGRDREGRYRLYRSDPEGGELHRLTDFPVADSWVGALPDDAGWVVCAVVDGDKELVQIDSRGAVQRYLTDNDADDCHPDVTPDGRTVVFWSNRGGSAELWAMALDGTQVRRLTEYPGNDVVPAHRYGGEGPPRISPDGRRIAWMSIREGEDWDVHVMALDGSEVRRLTDHLADDGYPSWSPDGRWLAFDSNRSGSFDVWVLDADAGGEPIRVTDDPAYEQAPVWVPRTGGRTE
jgi:TolB protein